MIWWGGILYTIFVLKKKNKQNGSVLFKFDAILEDSFENFRFWGGKCVVLSEIFYWDTRRFLQTIA